MDSLLKEVIGAMPIKLVVIVSLVLFAITEVCMAGLGTSPSIRLGP